MAALTRPVSAGYRSVTARIFQISRVPTSENALEELKESMLVHADKGRGEMEGMEGMDALVCRCMIYLTLAET